MRMQGSVFSWCFITGRNEVVAKVMFLHVCVILFTGGSASASDPPPGRRPPHRKEAPPGIRSMSGRYASYWNAFLLGKMNQFSKFACSFIFVSVGDCDPPIRDFELLVSKLNETNNLRSFIIEMRRRFKDYAESNQLSS